MNYSSNKNLFGIWHYHLLKIYFVLSDQTVIKHYLSLRYTKIIWVVWRLLQTCVISFFHLLIDLLKNTLKFNSTVCVKRYWKRKIELFNIQCYHTRIIFCLIVKYPPFPASFFGYNPLFPVYLIARCLFWSVFGSHSVDFLLRYFICFKLFYYAENTQKLVIIGCWKWCLW